MMSLSSMSMLYGDVLASGHNVFVVSKAKKATVTTCAVNFSDGGWAGVDQFFHFLYSVALV